MDSVPVSTLLAHRAFVRALARRLAADDAGADDVEQAAWLAAIERPPRHGRGLLAWLARLVRHRAADARRADGRRALRESLAPAAADVPSPAQVAARMESIRRVVAAVARLPEPYRSTVVLRFYDDLSVAQIAERTRTPQATVRTRLARAYARLRDELGITDETRDEWLALVAPWPGLRRLVPLATTGAIVMSVKLWIGAGVTAALLLAAIAYSPTGAAPRRAATERGVEAAAPVRPHAPAAVVANESTRPAAPAAGPAEPTGALVVEARSFRDEVVAGAIVELHRDTPAPAADVRQAAGDDGVARLPKLPAGTWSVVAHADGFADANRAVIVPQGSERRITLFLDRGHELRGIVRDPSGAPVAGALVGCVSTRPRTVTADASGAFVLTGLPSGEVQLRAGRSGQYLSHNALVAVPDVATIDLVLTDLPTVTAAGTVVDDATGAPIEGVVVGCAVGDPPPCLTDASGRFRLAAAGSHFLEVITLTKPGYRRFPAPRPATVDPPPGGVVDVGTLRMQHGATIEGVVSSPEGPIEGAEVIVTSPSRMTGSERRTARTDAAGRYSFPSVEAGLTQFWATAPGFIAGEKISRSGQLAVPESGSFRADFAFTRGAVVEGRVLDDDGHGVPGAYVIVDEQVTTGADGAFRCTGIVPRAAVPVIVMTEGFMRSDSTIDVGAGTTSNVVLRIRRSPIVRGRLVARDGRAIEGARVLIVSGTSRDAARISVNDGAGDGCPVLGDGSFEARIPFSVSGTFTVVAWTSSHAPSRSAPVAIVAGQREYAGVEVPLDAGATIRGRVVADGRGVAGASVRLGFAGYGYTTPPVRATTDPAGAFAIEHVVPSIDGRIYVTASLPGFVDATVRAAADSAGDVTVVLEKPLVIAGVVETREHAPLARLCVRADPLVPDDGGSIPPQHISFTDPAGRFRIEGLRAGKYRLTVLLRAGMPPAVEDAIDAGTEDVVISCDR